MEETELDGQYEEIAQHALKALDLSAENEIELTTITRDSSEGLPIAACVLVVGTPSRVQEVLDVIKALEQTWDREEAVEGEKL